MTNISENLQGVITQMLKPLKGLQLSIVIEGLSGYKAIEFDKDNKKDKKVLETLIKVASDVVKAVNKKGIQRKRSNEVGNDIEAYVKESLNSYNYQSFTPETSSGNKKSTGYPDIEFIDEYNRANYLECKTYNLENISTTFRSFYLSPSSNFKITKDAHHFGISFEIFIEKSNGSINIYKAKKWKILDFSKLKLDVKYEFNSDNKRLYSDELILAES